MLVHPMQSNDINRCTKYQQDITTVFLVIVFTVRRKSIFMILCKQPFNPLTTMDFTCFYIILKYR